MKFQGLLAAATLLHWFAAAAPQLGNEQFTRYLQAETARLSDASLSDAAPLENWSARKGEYRRQLEEILGLSPMPPREDLKAVVTGKLEHDEFTVEKLHFQASPGLYCTAALFIPKALANPAPAILYACGHWQSVSNGISFGNKAVYQADGAWYARNGYVCLVLDTVLAGEIRGIHTGTRDRGLWWWNARGYTPAGVEAWFGMRALDYLSTRPEVDTNRFGVTGHSGGGAYSWMITALDDRIRAAAPLAGMADARSHILDPVMDSHCDCNFFINYHRWDFPMVAALAAPRPLLIGATDNDRLFNLPNTLRIHEKVRRVYQLHDATNRLGLIIAPGGHDETPELQLAVMRWFNRHLKGEPSPIAGAAQRFFLPEQLKVFDSLPRDAINTNIAESFVPIPAYPERSIDALREALLARPFAGWPKERQMTTSNVISVEREGMRLRVIDMESQENVALRLYVLQTGGDAATNVVLTILDDSSWGAAMRALTANFSSELGEEARQLAQNRQAAAGSTGELLPRPGTVQVFFAPRGIGLDAWAGGERTQARIRRRFMLLGQTRDSMRVWDIRQAIRAVDEHVSSGRPIALRARGDAAVNATYAALFEPRVRRLEVADVPESHLNGPDYLGILRVCDIPQVMEAARRAGIDISEMRKANRE